MYRMSDTAQIIVESFGSKTGTIDALKGVAYGVKVVGFVSKNNRYYKPSALRSAVPLYEGVKVYLDHEEEGKNKLGRKILDKFGVLRNVRFEENLGIFADLHFNPKHAYAESFAWDAENDAESLGLSHHASTLTARGRDREGRIVIEQIVKVKSVDIVPDPATTQSLFESDEMDDNKNGMPDGADPIKMMLKAMSTKIAEIAEGEGDGDSKMKSMAEMIGKQDKLMSLLVPAKEQCDSNGVCIPPSEKKEGDDHESVNPEIASLKSEIAGLKTLLESRVATDEKAALKTVIEGELKTAGLDVSNPIHVSDIFAGQLLATESVDIRSAMITERAALVGAAKRKLPTKPTSAAATVLESTEAPTSAVDFVKSLR